jgi:hypothetical protein
MRAAGMSTAGAGFVSPPGKVGHQEAVFIGLRELESFHRQAQEKQAKSHGHQQPGDQLQVQDLHVHDVLGDYVYRVNDHADRRYYHSSPKGVFLWWIKFHGFLSSGRKCSEYASFSHSQKLLEGGRFCYTANTLKFQGFLSILSLSVPLASCPEKSYKKFFILKSRFIKIPLN